MEDCRYNPPSVDFPDFQPALLAATVMNAFDRPWCLAGGWAIDFWLGRLTRSHADVEVAVFREDQIALRDFLYNWRFFIATTDDKHPPRKPWRREDRQLLMLPVHELHAINARGQKLQLLLNESDSVDWLYRRDQRIRWPREQWTVRGAFGVPVIAPHLALLYKSKRPRDRDELDLRSAAPQLDSELRSWLCDAIALADANHPWLAALESVAAGASCVRR